MSLAVVLSRGLAGLDAPLVTVECRAGNGLPKFSLVGLTETEVRRGATACARRCRTRLSISRRVRLRTARRANDRSMRSRWRRFHSHPKAELY
jgi:hypothetical protein